MDVELPGWEQVNIRVAKLFLCSVSVDFMWISILNGILKWNDVWFFASEF